MTKQEWDVAEVEAFLVAHHGGAVGDVELLRGGFWSSAFGYRSGGRELVVRFGEAREGYDSDRAARAYDRPGLPVPEVFDIGVAFDGFYAISERRHGRFLEDVTPQDAEVAGPTVDRLLAALRSVPVELDAAAPPDTWHQWLINGLTDELEGRAANGWRAAIAAQRDVNEIFEICDTRVRELLEVCPERRDLLHGDLLHQNVLVNDDASRVTAVFSWKCSTRGDFLFDVAWCTFWGHWHPGIAALDVWRRTLVAADLRADPGALVDAPLRHHCYELQIGASHLGWYTWTNDDENLRRATGHLRYLLDRGPLRVD